MSLKCGIVGLPNVGKSTLFNALTKAGIAAENYPFCTIEPNVGVVEVPDPRLAQLAEIVKPERILPAIVEFVDIAGLVAGASKGEGLGNQFLAHIRETDAIVNVVRCFEDPNVIHVAGRVDPIADIEVIQTELCLADLATVEKALNRYSKAAKSGNDKEAAKLVSLLTPIQAALNEGKPARTIEVSKEDAPLLKQFCLITAKPAMFVGNVSEDGFENNPLLDRLKEYAAAQGAPVVAICAKIEAEMAEMSDEDRDMFLQEMGLEEPGLNRLIRAGFSLLGLQTYFTAGVKEVRAWTIKVGDTAPQAAGVIHGDFERGGAGGVLQPQHVVQRGAEQVLLVVAQREAGAVRAAGEVAFGRGGKEVERAARVDRQVDVFHVEAVARVRGIAGRLLRNRRPYPLVARRGSHSTSTPRSCTSRINRPAPCFSAMTALGTCQPMKGLMPACSSASRRACNTGSSGAANGSLSITTTLNASPATSTPSQKLAAPSSTPWPLARNSSSRRWRGAVPCTNNGHGTRSRSRSAARRKARCEVNSRNARPCEACSTGSTASTTRSV